MRPVTLNPEDPASSLREIERASHENDVGEAAQNFSFTGAVTVTTNLNISSPTLANTNAVLATLLEILQKGGINRTT
jgi:hypothetical protein